MYIFEKPYTSETFEQTYICTCCKPYLERVEKESKLNKLGSEEGKALLEDLRKEKIGNITENIDEMVYVVDIETYELYYLNTTGTRITDVYDYDYKGRIMAPVLREDETVGFVCTDHPQYREEGDGLVATIASFQRYTITSGE